MMQFMKTLSSVLALLVSGIANANIITPGGSSSGATDAGAGAGRRQ